MSEVKVIEKLNMDDYLFHAISAFFYDGYSSTREEESEILRKILNTKFIASRKYLDNILDQDKREVLESVRSVQYYVKDDSVSISFTPHSNIGQYSSFYSDSYWEDNPYFSYNAYKNKPAIILNAKLLDDLPRIYSKWKMPGEIQIEDKIPIEYFVGIALPCTNLNLSIDRVIENFDTSEFDDTSLYSEIRQDLMNLSEEEFVNKYYQDVILFEKVLQETDSSLKLYHMETGEELLMKNDEIEYIKNVKKKIYIKY